MTSLEWLSAIALALIALGLIWSLSTWARLRRERQQLEREARALRFAQQGDWWRR